MEALGGYADTESRESLGPPEQHTADFPHSDYMQAWGTDAPHPDILHIENAFFSPRPGFCPHLGAQFSLLMLEDTLFRK